MSKFIIPIKKCFEMKPFEISIRLKKIIRAIIAKVLPPPLNFLFTLLRLFREGVNGSSRQSTKR